MAGRGAKFKKYYEKQEAPFSITASIESTLGTGHRLANLAVAPIMPSQQRGDLMNKMNVRNMWQELEELDSSSSGENSRLKPSNSVSNGGDCFSVLEGNMFFGGKCSPGQTKKLTKEKFDKMDLDQSIADFVEEHDEYGCDVSNESVGDESREMKNDINNELTVIMTGVKKEGRYEEKKGRGRGRRRYCGNLGE